MLLAWKGVLSKEGLTSAEIPGKAFGYCLVVDLYIRYELQTYV